MAAKNIKAIKILGIDTSCDDTAVAIVKIKNQKSKIKNFEILSNVVSSQVKLHAKYGGVYPFLAKREHQKNLPLVFKKALGEAGLLISGVDFIAVTVGPGLEPCLWQGINFAKEIAKKYNKPLISVNHIEAHILANFLSEKPENQQTRKPGTIFPAVCLVVSGGHTQLILMRKIGEYKLIGETRDDAAGECLDKVARILGLGYPGGPAVAKFASLGNLVSKKETKFPINLPRPMMYTKNYDFSFSGLKTAVLYKVRERKYNKSAMAAEVQQAVIDVLIHKTVKTAKDFRVKSIILAGGVVANDEFRKQFNWKLEIENWKFNLFVPPLDLCTDNAAMVAVAAFYHRAKRVKNIKAEANLRIS